VLFVIAERCNLARSLSKKNSSRTKEAIDELHRLDARAMITELKAVAESVAVASASMMSERKFCLPTKRQHRAFYGGKRVACWDG